jgi:cell division septation protein DedD
MHSIERQRHDDAGDGPDGGTAPGLAVAEDAVAVVQRPSVVDGTTAAGHYRDVVRDVSGKHHPDGDDDRFDDHTASVTADIIREVVFRTVGVKSALREAVCAADTRDTLL